nr:MAG TPA_asm: hypothetical protein [Bacteriophage sp.]
MVVVAMNFRFQWTQQPETIYLHPKLYLLKIYGILMACHLKSFVVYQILTYLIYTKLT